MKVSSKRGFIKAKAVVTKRIKPLTVNNQTVHQIGIPLHWGWEGVAKRGFDQCPAALRGRLPIRKRLNINRSW